jgi:hypothetical protein
MELDNANPTIVNTSEIPSYRERRQIKDASQKKHGIRELLMGKSSYAIDPFYLSDYSDTDSDDSNVEPIDEQEIYGESKRQRHLSSRSAGAPSVTFKFCCHSCVPVLWLEKYFVKAPLHVLSYLKNLNALLMSPLSIIPSMFQPSGFALHMCL